MSIYGICWGEPERAPHRREVHARFLYIYIYIYGTSVTRAPPYTKRIGRMKYLAMKNPRQEKSNAEPHIDEKYMRDSYIYIYIWYVRHPRAALYKTYRPHEILSDEKSASRKIKCGPRGRRRSSKPALHNRPYIVIMLSKEQTVI